jgi:hypothetical protein
VFDSESYRVWHGTAPMADFFRVSDPGMFLVSGTGCTVRDEAGREYLDARSSMWNVTLGYSCEPVKAALHAQIDLLPSGTVMRYEHPTAIAAEYADCLPSPLDRRQLAPPADERPGPAGPVRIGQPSQVESTRRYLETDTPGIPRSGGPIRRRDQGSGVHRSARRRTVPVNAATFRVGLGAPSYKSGIHHPIPLPITDRCGRRWRTSGPVGHRAGVGRTTPGGSRGGRRAPT